MSAFGRTAQQYGGIKSEHIQTSVAICHAKTGENHSPVRHPADYGNLCPDGPLHLESV